MLRFRFVVIVLLLPKESLQKCITTYVTHCDSVEDIRNVKVNWTDLIIGSINENNDPSSKFYYADISRLGHLNSLTIIGQLSEIVPNLEYPCYWTSSLQTLIFYGNKLKTIRESSFPGMKLYRISLAHNQIEVIEKNAFAHGPGAVQFDVSHNLLESVEKFMFDIEYFVDNTKVLDLSYNRIAHIQSGSLPRNLQFLKLDYNKMRLLQKDVFQNMTQMTSLTITNNQLYALPDFDAMVNLEILDLSRNKIEEISPLAFAKLTKLFILDLSHNLLHESGFLNKYGLVNKDPLTVSVAFNRLDKLDNLSEIIRPKQILNLSLFGNPWKCENWQEISKAIANTKGLNQEICDLNLFSNGQAPYCLPQVQNIYYNLEAVQKNFAQAIATTKGLIPCKLGPSIHWNTTFGCAI